MQIRILFLEDTPNDVDLMKYELRKTGTDFISETVETEAAFISALDEFRPDIIISDYSLPSFDGLKAFRLFRQKKLMIPFILVTSNISEQLALDCLNEGIDDFILKSSFARVPKAVRRAIEKKNIEKEKELIAQELIESQIQLRALVNEIQVVREVERAHIAREIHDELGQQLTALKMDIGWVIHKKDVGDDASQGKLNNMLRLCDTVIDTVRRISSELRPPIIDDLGLIPALEWKCGDFEEKTKIPCRFISEVVERRLDNELSINAFRVLQESLTNIARHAKATSVKVKVTESEEEFCLEIIDNGEGMKSDITKDRKSLGILGMKERAGLLGGTLNTISIEEKGTHIILTLPYKNGNSSS